MNFKFVIFLLNVAVAVCSQRSHAHQNLQWGAYNANTNKRIRLDRRSSTTTQINSRSEVENKINITVYYETLCPASVRFFTKELKSVVEAIPSRVDVQLVPYGHARTLRSGGRYVFRCQHGPAECFGNKLHACALDALPHTQAVLFNACLMQYSAYRNARFDVSVLNWCGYKLNAPIHGVWECVNSERGSLLLRNYGVLTHALRPRYVPYVVLDGSVDNQAGGDLMSTLCQKLQPAPSACVYYTYKGMK